MKIILNLPILVLKLIYFFLKLFPTKKKIIYLSRQANTPSVDFRLLNLEIKKMAPDVKQVMITRRMERNFSGVIKNIWVIFPQMYHLATAKVCVVDGYSIPVSVLKHKKDLKVFQIWHSLLAVKNFGLSSDMSSKKKTLTEVLKMHKNYDYITCANEAMIDAFSKAFGYGREKFLPLGLPRTDYLLENTEKNAEKIKNAFPDILSKDVILYAPTFRDYGEYKIEELIASKPKGTILVIKKHPNMNCNINFSSEVLELKEFSALEILSVATAVITDYSGIIAEASVLRKPIFIYSYDYQKYESQTGLNIDLKTEFKGYVFYDAKTLFESFANKEYDYSVVERFKEKYVPNFNGTATEKLAHSIIDAVN